MKDFLEKYKKAVIILPKIISFDHLAAAKLLTVLFPEKFYIGGFTPSGKISEKVLELSQKEIICDEIKSEFILTIKSKDNIRDVKWRQTNDKIQFIITPQNGKFEYQNIDLQTKSANFDLALYIGLKDPNVQTNFFQKNQKLLSSIDKINLNIDQSNWGNFNYNKSKSSFIKLVFGIAKENQIKLNENALRLFFKSFFIVDEGFEQDQDTKVLLQEIIDQKLNFIKWIDEIKSNFSEIDKYYIDSIFKNLRQIDQKVFLSSVNFESRNDINSLDLIYPEKNLIKRHNNLDTVAIITKFNKYSEVSIYSKNEKMDLLNTFSDFAPIGTKQKITFFLENSQQFLERIISKRLIQKEVPKNNTYLSSSTISQQNQSPKIEPLAKSTKEPTIIQQPQQQINPINYQPLKPFTANQNFNTLNPTW